LGRDDVCNQVVSGKANDQPQCSNFSFFMLHVLLFFSDVSCVAPVVPVSRSITLLAESTTMSEIEKIQSKWNEVRLLSKEEASSLEGEWKEAYDRFYERYDRDMERSMEIVGKLQDMIEPPRIQKKTNGQRRRDKWAIVQARAAARAAAAK
jgi:hypothetical protein